MRDYDGLDLVDADGTKIGTVEDTYVDDRGTPSYAEVKIGALRAKHRLVPLDDSQVENGALQVPYSKKLIESSPDASEADGSVSSDLIERVQTYYAAAPTDQLDSADDADDGASADSDVPVVMVRNTGTVRDTGDAFDVPILEDVPGQGQTVTKVLRVPKNGSATEIETAATGTSDEGDS